MFIKGNITDLYFAIYNHDKKNTFDYITTQRYLSH